MTLAAPEFFAADGICRNARCSSRRTPVRRTPMHQSDDQFLIDKAAECRERAGRARNDRDRTLWLEMAKEIASRLPQEPSERLDTVTQPGERDSSNG